MCKKNKTFKETIPDLDELLSGNKLKFIAQICEKFWKHEREREESILNQSGRLQAFQTIFTAAFYIVVPMLIEQFEENVFKQQITWFFTILISIFVIIGIGLTFFAQLRYKYKFFPSIQEMQTDVANYPDDTDADIITQDYLAHFFPEIIRYLEKNNNRRCRFLNWAMWMFFICLILSFAMIVVLIIL